MRYGLSVLSCLLIATPVSAQESGYTSIFDGSSLAGWEGDFRVFAVEGGSIVAGSLEQPIPQREYLCTSRSYSDFELRFRARVEGNPNAGVHFRSRRIGDTNEVGGYQADIGFIAGRFIRMLSDFNDVDTTTSYPLWGSLLDEFRQTPGRYPDPNVPFWLLSVADRETVEGALLPDGWNELTVIARGPRIQILLNGVQTVDFVESEDLDQSGFICLQLHDGPPSKVWYRDLRVRELTDG